MVRSCTNERGIKKPRPKAFQMHYLQNTSRKRESKDTTEDLMEVLTSDMDLNKKYERIETKLKEQEEQEQQNLNQLN